MSIFDDLFGENNSKTDKELIEEYQKVLSEYGIKTYRERKVYFEIQERIKNLNSKFLDLGLQIKNLGPKIAQDGTRSNKAIRNHSNFDSLKKEQYLLSLRIKSLQRTIGMLSDYDHSFTVDCNFDSKWFVTYRIKDSVIAHILYIYKSHDDGKTKTHLHGYIDRNTNKVLWHAKKRGNVLMMSSGDSVNQVVYYDHNQRIVTDPTRISIYQKADNLRIFNGVMPTWMNYYLPMLGRKYS